MQSQTVNLQKRKKDTENIDEIKKRLFLTLSTLSVLLIISLVVILILRKTIIYSVDKQKDEIADLKVQIEEHKSTEGLYLTLVTRLKKILQMQEKQGFVAKLPELLYNAISPYGNITGISISDEQFKFEVDTGKARDVDLVIQALNKAIEQLGIKPVIVADSTDIDENGNHTLQLTISYGQEQEQSNNGVEAPVNNGEEIKTGI